MSDTEKFLLKQLSTPGFHGGDKLGQELGISRVAVSKHMASLREKGLPLISVAGKGYRLDEGVILLNRQSIEAYIDEKHLDQLVKIHIHQQIESTNQWLLDQEFHQDQAVVCVSEAQLAGRGRRERQWHSTAYRNLMFSLAWRFSNWPSSLSAVSLLSGLVVAEALEICGVAHVKIKWPNDIYLNNKKLGGLLVSAKGEASGACDLVVGVGINHHILENERAAIDQDWIDLQALGHTVDRNQLAALITEGFIDLLPQFEKQGFGPFKEAWNSRGLYIGEEVRLFSQTTDEIRGTCGGVDDQGVLQIQQADGSTTAIRDADLSMRLVSN